MTRKPTEVIYDREDDTAYVPLAQSGDESDVKAQVVLSEEHLPGPIVVELDANGRVRGLRLRSASRSLPLELMRELR